MANLSDKFSSYGLSLATAQVEYLINSNSSTSETNGSNTTGTLAYGSAGQALLAFSNTGNWVVKRVQAITAFSATDRITVEASKDGNEWFDAAAMFPAMEAGSSKYGIDVEPVDSTNLQVDIRFGGDGANGSEAWSAYTSWFWRVRVTRANLSAGFGNATATTAGLVMGGTLPGSTSGAATAAGYVGEFLEDIGSQAAVTSAVEISGLLVTLTTGVWLISGVAQFNGAAGAADTSAAWKIKGTTDSSTVKGTASSGTPAGLRNCIPLSTRAVVVASGDADKTIKVVVSSTSSQTVDGYISATRIG